MPKACVIAGAGATYADAVSLPVTRRPPLDRGFFSIANYGGRAQDAVGYIRPACSYMEEKYGIRLVRGNPSDDSFELALSTFYIDMVSPALQKEARDMFMMLIHGFNRWLAASTNTLNPGRAGRFYRILASLLNGGYASRDITIITLNQDIQIEAPRYSVWVKLLTERCSAANFGYYERHRPVSVGNGLGTSLAGDAVCV